MIDVMAAARGWLSVPLTAFSVNRRLLVYAVESFSLTVLLSAYAWVYLTHGFRLDGFFNSDALYLPALMQDLISDGGRYSEWNLTPSPYYFPDWPMYALSYVLAGGSVYYGVLVFSLLQFAMTYMLLRLLYVALFADLRGPLFAVVTMALLVSMTLDSVPIVQEARLSAHHFGELMVILFSLWLTIRILRSRRDAWGLVILLCAMTFLTGLSDGLFIIHYAVPVVLAADFVWRRGEIAGRQFLAVGLLPALSAFAGNRLTLSVMPKDHEFKYRFGMEYFDKNVDRVELLMSNVLSADILALLVIPAAYFAILAALGRDIWRKPPSGKNAPAALTLAFVITSLLVSLVMALLINVDIPGRYIIPAFILPIVLLFVPAVTLERPAISLVAAGVIGALAFGSIAMTVIPNGFNFHSTFYPAHIACMDSALSQKGLTYGIAQYWTAKNVTYLSHAGLKVLPFHRDLEEYHWINSSAWFRPAYDFAILEGASGPDEAKIRSINGEPEFVERCGQFTIIGYGRDGLLTSKPNP